jgi:hypothetical protein
VPRRWLHGENAERLEDVVLDDVADRSDAVVEGTAAGDIERLGHRDLHRRHVVGVPDRLEEPVGEAKVEQVLYRFLAEVVVDPEDPCLVEDPVERRVEATRLREVPPEGLLDDDPCPVGAMRLAEQRDHGAKVRWRDGQVVQWALRRAQLGPQATERVGIVVGPVDEAELTMEAAEDPAIPDALGGQALRGALAERGQVAMASQADDRHRPTVVADEARQRREYLPEGQVPGRTEEHECIRGGRP